MIRFYITYAFSVPCILICRKVYQKKNPYELKLALRATPTPLIYFSKINFGQKFYKKYSNPSLSSLYIWESL